MHAGNHLHCPPADDNIKYITGPDSSDLMHAGNHLHCPPADDNIKYITGPDSSDLTHAGNHLQSPLLMTVLNTSPGQTVLI